MADFAEGVYADYYVGGSTVEFEEGDRVEFKLHRTMCIEDLSRGSEQEQHGKLKRTRQPISKILAAFLSSGVGGVVFLGISDEGRVSGLQLTQYQKEHVLLSVKDVVSRFSPPVDLSSEPKIQVQFAPVVQSGQEGDYETKAPIQKPAIPNPPHRLRTPEYCWCDKQAWAQLAAGEVCERYVVKLWVKPWRCDPDVDGVQLPTLYENEEGLCYVRRTGSNVHYTVRDAVLNTQNQCRLYYEPKIRKLQTQMDQLVAAFDELLKVPKEGTDSVN